MEIEEIWKEWQDAEAFSGVFSLRGEEGVLFEKACGLRNRSEGLPNMSDTSFGIASGTKLFTGLAVCRLIDAGKASLEDRLWDLLPYDLGEIDRGVTVRHLLTHTSGVGDYIDEEDPDSYAVERALCEKYPVYLWERLEYYLPMITPLPKKFEPGARFGYSNAGFILLGLVVEAVSGKTYQDFVTEEIIVPLGLRHTGFYRMDALPANTAIGYTGDLAEGPQRMNIFSLPIVGGSDGGLFTCAEDLDTLWRAVFGGRVLSEKMLRAFLVAQVKTGEQNSYGLGVYRTDRGGKTVYYALGGDFGVNFFSAYFPDWKQTASALANGEMSNYPLFERVLENWLV